MTQFGISSRATPDADAEAEQAATTALQRAARRRREQRPERVLDPRVPGARVQASPEDLAAGALMTSSRANETG